MKTSHIYCCKILWLVYFVPQTNNHQSSCWRPFFFSGLGLVLIDGSHTSVNELNYMRKHQSFFELNMLGLKAT